MIKCVSYHYVYDMQLTIQMKIVKFMHLFQLTIKYHHFLFVSDYVKVLLKDLTEVKISKRVIYLVFPLRCKNTNTMINNTRLSILKDQVHSTSFHELWKCVMFCISFSLFTPFIPFQL